MASQSPSARAPIAILGLSCRFAGEASNASKFWELLKSGRDAFSQNHDRFNADAFQHSTGKKDRHNVIPTKGGFILEQDPYVFDASFFVIRAAEAMTLDPRQRLAMEVAYEALENAGMPLQKVAGTQTSAFMGSAMSDYRTAVDHDFTHYPKYHLLGISDEMISNRISHSLDVHRPSATIQTACSSSHVATHLACLSIHSGEAEMALAGGVGLILSPEATMHLNNLQFLSPEGKSKTFDSEADEYGRGEGCGVLVLKRLDKAVADGDNIRATIRASSINSDGWTQGVTMPSRAAQASLIKYVYESNDLNYSSTQYVEAHGTGTKAGDPAKTGAIHDTIVEGAKAAGTSRKKLWLGSVKPNIGHLEAAAGVASIIKGVLAMENSFIPPNINFDPLNPDLPLDKWDMAVPTKLTPWPPCQTKRMSISGFGMGGTNAHLVLESFNKPAVLLNGANFKDSLTCTHSNKKRLFTFSKHDQAGFKRIRDVLVEHIDWLGPAATNPGYLADFSHALATARSGLSWKDTCVAESAAELRELIATALGDKATRAPSVGPLRIGLVFTGQGAQWASMGIELMERKVSSKSFAKSAAYMKEMGCDWDPIVELSKVQKESRLSTPVISQPICSLLQIRLVDELASWGITPSKVVGHSSGEIAAAYSIGALSHRDAVAAACFRGKFSATIPVGKGGMTAVGCSPDEAQTLMEETNIHVTIACVNSPSSLTLSGDVEQLKALQAVLDERSIFARRVKVDVAYHSSHMHASSV